MKNISMSIFFPIFFSLIANHKVIDSDKKVSQHSLSLELTLLTQCFGPQTFIRKKHEDQNVLIK